MAGMFGRAGARQMHRRKALHSRVNETLVLLVK